MELGFNRVSFLGDFVRCLALSSIVLCTGACGRVGFDVSDAPDTAHDGSDVSVPRPEGRPDSAQSDSGRDSGVTPVDAGTDAAFIDAPMDGGDAPDATCRLLATEPASPTRVRTAEDGDEEWSDLDGALSQSPGLGSIFGTAAQAVLSGSTPRSDTLELSGFELRVPPSATVRGILVEPRLGTSFFLRAISLVSVQLLKDEGPVGDNPSATDPWPDVMVYAAYGGETELWSTPWAAEEINSPDFGVSIVAGWRGLAGNDRALVDHVRVTVFYTDGC